MQKLRIRKEFGTWFYEKEESYDLDAPIYHLYDDKQNYVGTFGIYHQMNEAIKHGNIEEYINIYG